VRSAKDLFKAEAASLWDTMTSHNGTSGFIIPEYQRTYDWSEDKLKRLLEDCLNGFHYLIEQHNEDSYTFLGTIILVLEKRKEASFDGASLAIVDGQQRLTSLILMSCALIEAILAHIDDLTFLSEETGGWLKIEADFHIEALHQCTTGALTGRGQIYPYPRLVRDGDNRARTSSSAEYRSTISRFLWDFSEYYKNEQNKFSPRRNRGNTEEDRFFRNYQYIKDQIEEFLYTSGSLESDLDCEPVEMEDFKRRGLIALFDKLEHYQTEPERNKAVSELAKSSGSEGLVRLLLFSSYLTKCVVLTRVETDDENAAFDIFDALNTTGEPLTALETFKPRVIQFERRLDGYAGSKSQEHFETLEKNLNSVYSETEKRQKATKDLLISFALYLDGYKLPNDLSSQRTFLRTRFDSVSVGNGPEAKRRFIESISDLAEYREKYWNPHEIGALSLFQDQTNNDDLKLCLMFISDMNTSLSVPIIARFWAQFRRDGDEETFLSSVKALTAFLVFRRSVTGNTGGIDADFRKIMQNAPKAGGDPLCVGLNHSNAIFGLSTLKSELRDFLAARKIEVENKDTWLKRVVDMPLVNHSRPLCRFLSFAAAHNSRPDLEKPGLRTREDVIPSEELAFLSFRNWQSEKYATVEHVAPESNPDTGWDKDIYDSQFTRQTLGNIVLLPQKENSSVGNAGWQKKKIFYDVLAARTENDRKELLKKAEVDGFTFSDNTKALLGKQERLHMLDPIVSIPEWTKKTIGDRTHNTLDLAWDAISPWLFD
jgi:uncharacterized protein with ParB-like and HNH nuclease domain